MEFNVEKCKIIDTVLHSQPLIHMKGQILNLKKVERDIGIEVTVNLESTVVTNCCKVAGQLKLFWANCLGHSISGTDIYLSDYKRNRLRHTWRHSHRPGLYGKRRSGDIGKSIKTSSKYGFRPSRQSLQ
jgi:hypothetical protein